MIEREKIIEQVRQVVERNKLNKTFLPIIEEYFVRAAEQLNWDEENFYDAIKEFENVKSITFKDLGEKEEREPIKIINVRENIKLIVLMLKKLWRDKTLKKKTLDAYVKYVDDSEDLIVFFEIDNLKEVLAFDKNMIEEFINTGMHEFGHVVQKERVTGGNEEKEWHKGLKKDVILEDEGIIKENGKMLNEFAEVINACRLQCGNIDKDTYSGYESIQNAGKVVNRSLGISELELANLQYAGRKAYEEFIDARLERLSSQMYRDSFEELLDSIWKFSYEKNQRENFILAVEGLQSLSNNIFKARYEDAFNYSGDLLRDLAKISIDEEEKMWLFHKLFEEHYIDLSELKISEGIKIEEKILEKGYSIDDIIRFHQIQKEEELKRQQEKDRQNEKVYDNEELIENIYQNFLSYPIDQLTFKERIGIKLAITKGKIERWIIREDAKRERRREMLLRRNVDTEESRTCEANIEHKKFADEISNLEGYTGERRKRIEEDESKQDENAQGGDRDAGYR